MANFAETFEVGMTLDVLLPPAVQFLERQAQHPIF